MKTIRMQLIVTYTVLIALTFAALGFAFREAINAYVISETRVQLQQEALFVKKVVDTRLAANENKKIGLKLVGRIIEADYLILNSDRELVYASNPTHESLPEQAMQRIITSGKNRGSHTMTINGNAYVFDRTAFLPDKPNRKWLVLYSPLAEVESVSDRLIGKLLPVFLLISLLMIAVSIWLAGKLTTPLRRLTDNVHLLARRKYGMVVKVDRKDEIGQLSTAIQRMAEELKQYDESQKRFLQNASHELKTPLMSIQGYAEGIRDGVFSGEGADRGLSVIVEETQRMKAIVDELIVLSKLDHGDEFFRPEETNIGSSIIDSLSRIAPLADQRGIALHHTMHISGDSTILVDAERWMQALLNVLANAVRHARAAVTVSVESTPGNFVIHVHDDGEGIDGKLLPTLFERFQKGKGGETGLGLAITKTIIEKSGGTITAANAAEGGARLTITMPKLSKNSIYRNIS